MGLFGKNKEEQAQEVQFEIRTQNSWFAQGLPKVIVRQIPNGDVEKLMNRGVNYLSPYIRMSECVHVVETDQTFEIVTKNEGLKVVPKTQVLEIQYF